MTYSKKAAIRTAIAVIAALFLAGCMTGDHGVKRMAGAGSAESLGRARIHGRKRQARDRGHGGGNHGGVVSRQRDRRLARQAPAMRPAHGKRRWRPVQAGCPRAGTIPIPATQGRFRQPAPTDRPAESTAGNTELTVTAGGRTGQAHGSACRQPNGVVAGIELAPPCSWRPARRSNGGDRFNCPCAVQPFRLHPVPLRRREPELEPKAGEGGCRRGCPRPVPHSRNPGDRYARPRTRYPRHPAVPTRTLARQRAQDAGRCFGLHRAQGLDRCPRAAREPDCPRHGTRHRMASRATP